MLKDQVSYYILCETLVDPDTAQKNRKIIHENVTHTPTGTLCTLTFEQVLQSFNCRNWNGRIYDENTVMKAIQTNPLIQYDLKMGTWTGEYGHPQIEKGQNELARQMTILPDRACWTIDRVWVKGNLLMGQCTTLAGGFGDMMRDRILTGYPAMASSRAVGGTDSSGKVLPGYSLVTFDGVIRPSHKEAYANMSTVRTKAVANIGDGYKVPAGNTMQECAIQIQPDSDSMRAFLMSESVAREKIEMVCDTMKLDVDSMVLTENSLKITRIDEGTRTTLIMPLHKLVGSNQHWLFD